jgi:hypothetical protein
MAPKDRNDINMVYIKVILGLLQKSEARKWEISGGCGRFRDAQGRALRDG